MLDILKPMDRKQLDTLFIALLHYSQHNILPELYEIFGEESLLKFLDLFSGMTIKVPSHDQLSLIIRDVNIYIRLSRADKKADLIRELMSEYGIEEERSITRIYTEIETIVTTQAALRKAVGGSDGG
jgi:hypothetical protein